MAEKRSWADKPRRRLGWLSSLAAVIGLSWSGALAQELEPRSYSASPVGTNFLLSGYGYSSGDVFTDPSAPVKDVQAKIHSGLWGYSRTIGLGGRMANVAMLVPFVDGNVQGEVGEESREVNRSGYGDVRFRLSTNLLGGDALAPEEFAKRAPTRMLGTSLTIIAPTGVYDSKRLINVSSNRWAFKPELGVSQTFGEWFAEAAAGVWFYTDNDDFFGGKHRSQDPLSAFQLHGGYTFSPGLWLAVDATYYTGGETTVDGVSGDDSVANTRYGMTLSLPVSRSTSLKFAWSESFTTRIGGDFSTFGVVLQYRWFDKCR